MAGMKETSAKVDSKAGKKETSTEADSTARDMTSTEIDTKVNIKKIGKFFSKLFN
jgi:hypothetical protein